MTSWTDFAPQDAAELNLAVRTDIAAPVNEQGERCPWPWEPQQFVGVPLGQYHCPHCGAMVIAGIPPEWEPHDFKRAPCLGVPGFGPPVRRRDGRKRYGGRCSRHRTANRTVYQVPVPVPDVVVPPEWLKLREGEREDNFATRVADDHCYRDYHHAVCWACGGKGYVEQSRVEREAPTVWVPRDVGLITVSPRGTKVVKPSPKRKDPNPIADGRKALNDLVRWVSHRPDPRHRSA